MIGELLGDRYEIIEEIGQGGMALVYKAKCQRLNRLVAIKILRPQFANDEEFVFRFQREAESAASLTHPNVVSIFDVCKDKDFYYMVMEYVKGKNLKELIDRRAPFTEAEAVNITRQICEALDKAHKQGIIHRDIKPHNIMIADDGRVKVTDFGIARAKTSSKVTEIGVVMGSVHYFSPEQAKGENVGARSDLYSLGVILYEMVTGRVPFEGDTPISIALKQIQEEPVPPSKYKPDISPLLEKIILKLLAKNPYERFASAGELRRALDKCCPDEPLFDDDATVILKQDDLGQTKVMSAVRVPESKADLEKTIPPVRKKKNKKKRIVLLSAAAVLLFCGLVFAYMNLFNVPEVNVPELTGKNLTEAEKTAREFGLDINISSREYSDNVPADTVIAQYPEAGRLVKKGRNIDLTLSRGPELKTVPDLTNKTLAEASIILGKENLLIGSMAEEYNDSVEKGKIIRQMPSAGNEVKKGSKIDLIVSQGKEPLWLKIPSLIGETLDNAKRILEEAGLKAGNIKESASDAEPGTVIQQIPVPGSKIKEGSAVQLIISGESSSEKSQRISFNVPAGPDRQTVKIIVDDDSGRRTIYNAVHAPGDVIEKNIAGQGSVHVKIYVSGSLYEEKAF
ncbi:MAG: Stk1 family PASTA domain-containing Ser/Thr kinase [bacterium]